MSTLLTQIVDAAGTSVLRDWKPVNGFRRVSFGTVGQTWRRAVDDDNYYQHGSSTYAAALAERTLQLVLKIRAGTWDEIEDLVEQTMADVSVDPWYLRVGPTAAVHRTWECGFSDVDAPMEIADMQLMERTVTLRIPAQPLPGKSF